MGFILVLIGFSTAFGQAKLPRDIERLPGISNEWPGALDLITPRNAQRAWDRAVERVEDTLDKADYEDRMTRDNGMDPNEQQEWQAAKDRHISEAQEEVDRFRGYGDQQEL